MSEDHSPSTKGDTVVGRTPPTAPVPALSILARRERSLFELEIHVVTPLFGGGPIAGVTDPDMPVRASGIRGQLRFWWRACQGARFTSADTLFAEEEALWGSTKVPSRVTVTVEILAPGTEKAAGQYRANQRGSTVFQPQSGWPSYALFPFQGEFKNDQVQKQPGSGREGIRFCLRLVGGNTSPDMDQLAQVRGALWAWLTFGGIGARTRRGCGSLFCAHPEFAPPAEPGRLKAWLGEQGKMHIALPANGGSLPIPLLHKARALFGTPTTPMQGWNTSVELMQHFRQVPEGRSQQGKVPGKSLWPEADSLRRIYEHKDPGANSFPRGDLGLPMVFQFKRSEKRQEPPVPMTLQPTGEKMARMASPIILKPLTLSPTQAVPLVLCLTAPHTWDERVLKEGIGYEIKGDATIPAEQLRARQSATILPLANQRTADVREAFLGYAKKQELGEEVLF